MKRVRDSWWLSVQIGVFLVVLGSSGYVWHARDWNVSSRLMLTYALVDRGTVMLDGLEDHTRDRARVDQHYYSDKAPGLALTGVVPYGLARVAGLTPHPLNKRGEGFTHWPGDAIVTLFVSGLSTAAAALVLMRVTRLLGGSAAWAAFIALAYGLATPAAVYASLAYGHQLAAFLLLACAERVIAGATDPAHPRRDGFLAGLCAGWAVVVELQLAPVAFLMAVALAACVARQRCRPVALGAFALGGLGPALVLLTYNQLAFGSPVQLGYFHEDIRQFREVHNAANPLGLRWPDWSKALPLLWGGYRGLLFYAPVVIMAPLGWCWLARREEWLVLGISLLSCLAVFGVNLSYPEWTGGWSTGPRLLVSLLPFAMIGVAAAGAQGPRWVRWAALVPALAGYVLMVLLQGAGGRVPQDIADPLLDFVWPIWRGRPFAWGATGDLARTALDVIWPTLRDRLEPDREWLLYAPLVLFQAGSIALVWVLARRVEPAGARSTNQG